MNSQYQKNKTMILIITISLLVIFVVAAYFLRTNISGGKIQEEKIIINNETITKTPVVTNTNATGETKPLEELIPSASSTTVTTPTTPSTPEDANAPINNERHQSKPNSNRR